MCLLLSLHAIKDRRICFLIATQKSICEGYGAAFFKMLSLDRCDAINYKFTLIINYLHLFVPNCNWYTPHLLGIYEMWHQKIVLKLGYGQGQFLKPCIHF